MLSIARLAATGAADYFLSEVAPDAQVYYTGAGEAPGRWVGSLSAELGLSGLVEPDALRPLLDGRHPATGEPLVCAPRAPECRHFRGEDGWLSTAAAAERLRVSARHVRRLITNWAGGGKGAGLAAENVGSEERPRWRVAE
ncbi:MAG: relaxase domain-containing protein, partial [Actinobacteria bacterium]|nr:relaxase domain-containing protein [Actinomycetota bacterium]